MKKSSLSVVVLLACGILVAAAGAASSGGFCADGPFTDKHTATVRMQDNCFSPTVVRVAPGEEVTWVNKDLERHALGGATNSFGDMHSEIASGAEISYTFETEGVFPYVCILHPGMAGAVVVGDGIGASTAAGDRSGGSGEAGAAETKTDNAVAASGGAPARTTGPGRVGPLLLVGGVLALGGLALVLRRRRPGAAAAARNL